MSIMRRTSTPPKRSSRLKYLLIAILVGVLTGCSLFQPLDKKLVSAKDKVREKAFKKLESLPPSDLEKLVPALIEFAKNDDSRIANRATEALTAIGPISVPALESLLASADVYTRMNAALALGRLGSVAAQAAPSLIKGLQDPHPMVREQCAYSLGQIDGNSPEVATALAQATKDTDPAVRDSAVGSMEKLGLPLPKTPRKLS